jgi:hypothetical protein
LRAIRAADPRAAIFLEAEANQLPPRWDTSEFPSVVFAPHWYDDLTLVKKHFYPWFSLESMTHRFILGRSAIRRSFKQQLQRLQHGACERLGAAPTLLAEFGIPFDLNGAKAYRTGNFRAQARALDRSYRAVEAALMHSTIWNYTPDNTNERGDQWNGEDLSIFSRDQQKDPTDICSGGRALDALLRPYPRATAGEPLRLSFDMRRRVFTYEFRHDASVGAPTEIFIPRYQYPGGYRVEVSDGSFEKQEEEQFLVYRHGFERLEHRIRIIPK